MAIQPRGAPLPPVRKWWVANQSNPDRRSCLIAEYLESLMRSRPRGEDAAIREFLTAYRKATVAGKLSKVTLMVRKRANQAIIFATVPGVGPVKPVPIIVVPWSNDFTQIMRECGELLLFSHDTAKEADAWGEPERPRKPPQLEKVTVHLVPLV